jgi:hypothetical protein
MSGLTRKSENCPLLVRTDNDIAQHASPTALLTSDNLRLSEPEMRSGEWLSRDSQTSGGELIQPSSDVAALVELSELEDQVRNLA